MCFFEVYQDFHQTALGRTPPVAAPPLSPGEGILPASWQGAGDPGPGDLGAPGKAAGGGGPRQVTASSRCGLAAPAGALRQTDSTPGRTGACLPAQAVLEPTASFVMGSVCSAVTQWESLSTCHLEDGPVCGRQNGSPLE